MDLNLSKLWEMVENRVVHGVAKVEQQHLNNNNHA